MGKRNLRLASAGAFVSAVGLSLFLGSEAIRTSVLGPALDYRNEATVWANLITMSGLVLLLSGLTMAVNGLEKKEDRS